MKHIRNRRLATLALVLAVGMTTACGPDIASTEPSGSSSDSPSSSASVQTDPNKLQAPAEESPSGEIVIWDRSGDLYEVFDAVIAKFNVKYPGVTVRHEAVDISAKLQNTLITGTDVPDGVFLDDAYVSGYADYLWDLGDVLAPYLGDIAKQKVDVNTVDGGIYGVPYDLDPGLLFYNTVALEEAGIDATTISTYDDLLAAAKKYQEHRPSAKPIHLEQGAWLGQLQLEMYANQLSTSIADADGQLRLDSPEYLKILSWLDEVAKQGLGTRAEYLTPSDIGALEARDEVFYPWAIWFDFAPQQQLPETSGEWRAMELPAWEAGGARGGAMGGSSFILPKQGKNSQLAWLFYEFLMFDETGYTAVYGPNEVYPGGINTSIPAYKPAADPAKPLFQPVSALGDQDLWGIAVQAGQAIPGGTPTPPWWDGAVEYLGNNVQKMLDQELTPQEVLSQSAEDIQANLIDRQ
jgi:lactose/L-arabinose transport system substrate-binding protein